LGGDLTAGTWGEANPGMEDKMDLQKLSEKVQAMLDGEKKRREVALEFVEKFRDILVPVAPDIWGDGCENCDAIYVWRVRTDNLKKERTDIYFRYDTHYGQRNHEYTGFYDGEMSGGPYWGRAVEELHGREFWYAMQVLIEWVPLVAELIDKKSASRDELLSLLA